MLPKSICSTPPQHVPFVIAIFTAGDVVGRYLPNLIGSIYENDFVPSILEKSGGLGGLGFGGWCDVSA